MQKKIASSAQISTPFLCEILKGTKRPSWKTAKRLARATGTTPSLWLEGSPMEIKGAISDAEPAHSQEE